MTDLKKHSYAGKTESAESKNQSHKEKMSHSQAGRLGGLAPHKCRGTECHEHSGSSNKSSSSENSRRS